MSDSKLKDYSQDSLRRRRRRRKKKHRDPFDLPGVRKIVLSALAQKIIGCVVGNEVNAENPWMFVKKENILDNIELHEESTEFLPVKKEILEFPGGEFLIGYIPEETRNYDEFYICLTKEATDAVSEIIQKWKAEQEKRLYNSINKTIKPWISQGTDIEVDEAILKNNRALLEVEIESQYPIFPSKAQLDTVKAEERRDGYMELKCVEGIYQNVYKKRIDAYVQVAPQHVTAEAQTICTYPSNMATQYAYTVKNTEELFDKCKQSIEEFSSENYDSISDLLRVNGTINMYTDDYNTLIVDEKFSKAVTVEEVKEYMSFMDVDLCKDKMIADACWHPMWTGIVAVSYVDIAPSIYLWGLQFEDKVLKAVHGLNVVLIWSSNDGLKPKLILESPRPVLKVSFCNFDSNILVGGCANGQIVIWDIRQKLSKVEELDILTPAQQRYRNYLHSLIGWMKNIHDVALVRPAVVSDLRYSPKGPITGITWMSPYYEFTKTGNLKQLPEGSEHSLQFLTSSESGSISLWDLLKKPTIQPGGFKQRKLRRLKSKPSALMMEISPFKVLHLNLKPMCQIKVCDKEKKKLRPISSIFVKYCNLQYVEECEKTTSIVNKDNNVRTSLPGSDVPIKETKQQITDRIIYRPVFDKKTQKPIEAKLHVGTMKGDYLYIKWEGLDFDSGEIVSSVESEILSGARYHDGPVNTVDCSQIEDFTLTVGGKVFALWHKDLPNRPLLWRKNPHLYTTGEWNIVEPYSFINKVFNGDVETWMVSLCSKIPVHTLTYSSNFLTASSIQPLNLKKKIYGAGDKQGTFRLYLMSDDNMHGTPEYKFKRCRDFIINEVIRKKNFLEWQETWNKNNEKLLQLRNEELQVLKEKEEEAQKKRAEEQAEEKAADKQEKTGPQPGKFVEWVIQQRQLEEDARIRSTVINKKQLDTKELEKRRKPLQKLEAENERKKRKQKQRLKEGDKIFTETVASLFPEVVKERPPPPPDPYAAGDNLSERQIHYKTYLQTVQEAENFVNSHPFKYNFNWKHVLKNGKERRNILNNTNVRNTRQKEKTLVPNQENIPGETGTLDE